MSVLGTAEGQSAATDLVLPAPGGTETLARKSFCAAVNSTNPRIKTVLRCLL